MADANHFIVTIRRAVDRTDIDPTITMAAHTLGGFEAQRIAAKRG